MPKPDSMGSTFAERTAAVAGDKDFKDPTPDPADPQENSTFAERAKGGKRSKAVQSDDGAENKAVAKKAAAKKS